MSRLEVAVAALGVAYLALLGWSMNSWSYDIWGAVVIVPILVVISIPLLNRFITGDLRTVLPVIWAGMLVKFGGAIVGYNLRFDAYGGGGDALRYHNVGSRLASDVREGIRSPISAIPSSSGTDFVNELTGLVYTVFGSSRLAGFMIFAWMSFWGLVFFLKAAATAIPQFDVTRYAALLFFLPSLVYWGSSIGKEAVVGFGLGLAAYGAALLFRRRPRVLRAVAVLAAGIVLVALVRPHFAAIWAGAAGIALIARIVRDATASSNVPGARGRVSMGTLLLAVVAVVGFVVIANVTLNQLNPAGDDDEVAVTDRLTTIFDRVEERTTQGGSSFTPPKVRSPVDWPYAAFRTMTRPVLVEADSLAELFPAIEMSVLLVTGVIGWRRFANVPRLMATTPYIVFAVICVVTFGVAFSRVGNLGLLVRQRSLILPLMLLFWCIPPLPRPGERRLRRTTVIRPRRRGVPARRPVGEPA